MTTFSRAFRSRRPVLVAAVIALFLLSCRNGANAGSAAAKATPDKPAQAAKVDFGFQLPTVDGRSLGPKSFPGQVVVVDFWATWCMPCRLQAEILEPVYRDYKGRGVQFLAANVGEPPADVKKFLKGKPFPYPVLLDADQANATRLGIFALPTLLVIDKQGRMSYFQAGIADGDTLREMIKKAGA
ncbi:MAG TPA: TlpA disulfide reductase family protein [Thermoanaerobaculia bacterium]|jgi:thiol-disulfide isomerase/thioredoxin